MAHAAKKAAPPTHGELGKLGLEAPRDAGECGGPGQRTRHGSAPCGHDSRESARRGHAGEHGTRGAARKVDARAKAITPSAAARRALRFGTAMGRSGWSVRRLAAALSVSPSLVGMWRTPADNRHPTSAQWATIEEVAPALFAAWCRLSLAETDERPRVRLCANGTAAALLESASTVGAELLRGLADGALDDAERARVARAVDGVEAAARQVRWALEVKA